MNQKMAMAPLYGTQKLFCECFDMIFHKWRLCLPAMMIHTFAVALFRCIGIQNVGQVTRTILKDQKDTTTGTAITARAIRFVTDSNIQQVNNVRMHATDFERMDFSQGGQRKAVGRFMVWNTALQGDMTFGDLVERLINNPVSSFPYSISHFDISG
jgi:hypothetical protein